MSNYQNNGGNKQFTAEEIEEWLMNQLASLGCGELDPSQPLVECGLDSAEAVILSAELEEWLGTSISPTIVWDYPTISTLTNYLAKRTHSEQDTTVVYKTQKPQGIEPIAIVGLDCIMPGANDPETFWRLLAGGADLVSTAPAARARLSPAWNWVASRPELQHVLKGGFISRIEEFDAAFFHVSPREAAEMDPQQRLLMETAWRAFENAGQPPDRLRGSRTGVFVGISNSDYSRLAQFDHKTLEAFALTGNALSISANRISYFFNLSGPSVAVDSACSSSLLAVHLACESLRDRHCDMALAAGVNLVLLPHVGIALAKSGALAKDGRCKVFDASADGYSRSEGCGAVVLKRLADALADRDPVLAVIRGSAVNQDGFSNGLTAPNGKAQSAVIEDALARAGVANSEISYVEAHGSGTPLGDPIELQALRAVLDAEDDNHSPCLVGSVKANVGHLESAAGIAGLIKTVLSLTHEQIPPQANFTTLNPAIKLEQSRLSIPRKLTKWPRGERKRYAGISSFGIGGTNVHLICEEAPLTPIASREFERPRHILTISARQSAALSGHASRFEEFLADKPDDAMGDICFTANGSRAHFQHRMAVVAGSPAQAREKLAEYAGNGRASGVWHNSAPASRPAKIAFLYTGHGAEYVNMGRGLYTTQPVFRSAMDTCFEIARPLLARPLTTMLYPPDGSASKLDNIVYCHAALLALEYALTMLWASWGVRPDAVLGHSVGEYAAAIAAGMLPLEKGLELVIERARLLDKLPATGRMAAVFASESVVQRAISGHEHEISIAAVNGREQIVISGGGEALSQVIESLKIAEVESRYLPVTRAAHSPHVELIREEVRRAAGRVSFRRALVPLVSNVTGEFLQEVPDAEYCVLHARGTVRFSAGVEFLHAEKFGAFLEIGPGATLLDLARACLASEDGDSSSLMLSSLKNGQDDWEHILGSLAMLYTSGANIDWRLFDQPYARRLLSIPNYQFQRKAYWLHASGAGDSESHASPAKATPGLNGTGPHEARDLPEPRSRHKNNDAMVEPGGSPQPERSIARLIDQQLAALSSVIKEQLRTISELAPDSSDEDQDNVD